MVIQDTVYTLGLSTSRGFMQSSTLHLYSHLRLLVGYLGEKNQFSWWPTAFLDATSRMFLEPAFPKTLRLAQYNGVSSAARRLHDEYIGVGNVFHLFRLPEEIEQDIQVTLIDPSEAWFSGVSSQENALKALRVIAHKRANIAGGPQAIGSTAQLSKNSGPKALAQYYLTAFEDDNRSYPYFTC